MVQSFYATVYIEGTHGVTHLQLPYLTPRFGTMSHGNQRVCVTGVQTATIGVEQALSNGLIHCRQLST